MPKSKRRKRRDGTAVTFRHQSSAVAGPVSKPQHGPPVTASTSPNRTSWLPTTIGTDAHLTRIEDVVVTLVNSARARHGARPLRVDEQLRRAARGHSQDMAHRRFHAHLNPDGVEPATRMRAHGYLAPGAENIARGQARPHEVMHAWLNSPGHRANILNPEFAAIGVGVCLGTSGPWWTQNFGY